MNITIIQNKLTKEEWLYVSKCVMKYERYLEQTRERCKRYNLKNKNNKFTCTTCNIRLSSKQSLDRHKISNKHLENKKINNNNINNAEEVVQSTEGSKT